MNITEGSSVAEEQPENPVSLPEPKVAAVVDRQQQNAFLVKAKRQLMRIPSGSERAKNIIALIAQYDALLDRSLQGEDCDDEIDDIEKQIAQYEDK